jgi:hypothetical protein
MCAGKVDSQHSCKIPLVMKAPSVPAANLSTFFCDFSKTGIYCTKTASGFDPTTMNILLKSACHLLPQKSARLFDFNGLLDRRGQASGRNGSGRTRDHGNVANDFDGVILRNR